MAAIGLYGGTFNPVHHGHLRGAISALELLELDQLVFVPAAVPPLKAEPDVSAMQRAAMVELAVATMDQCTVDCRELHRSGPSYTIDTLEAWRRERGASDALIFIMGSDAFANVHRWHRWESLLDYASIAVTTRPGVASEWPPEVANWAADKIVDAANLSTFPAGKVAFVAQPPLDISSTDIRRRVRAGKNVQFLLPDAVIDYIQAHNLYQDDDFK